MEYYLDIEKELNYDNIIIGADIKIKDNLSYNYIYYYDEKPKDIIIQLPSIRVINNYENNKFNQIKLPLYPHWDKMSKFIIFIKKLERYLLDNTQSKHEERNLIEKYDGIRTLKINLTNNVKIISNDPKITSINDFKYNGEIELNVKIAYIYKRDNYCGVTLFCNTIKYTNPYEYYNEIKKSIPPPVSTSPKIQTVKMAFNPIDLLNMKNKLKKVD